MKLPSTLLSFSLILFLLSCTKRETEPIPPKPSIDFEEEAEEPKSLQEAVVKTLVGELWQGDRRLLEGDRLLLNESLELRKGHAVLEIKDVGSLRIYPKTRFRFPDWRRVSLMIGKLWAKIAPGGVGYTVETANAVAGVRGTEFIVERSEKRTRVAVAQGRVALSARADLKSALVLEAGQQSQVTLDELPAKAKGFDPKPEEDSWQKALPQKPAVQSDRKAFEKHEKRGREQLQKLEQEREAVKRDLREEEQKVRESLGKDRESIEEDLEKSMNKKHQLIPEKGSLKAKDSLRPKQKKDSEIEDLLR